MAIASECIALNSFLFDYLVRAGEQRRRHVEAERLRGGQIDYKIEFGRLFDGDVCGLRPTQNLVD